MAYYRNNYESYYRKMKNVSIRDKDNRNKCKKGYIGKKGNLSKILIYDLTVSLLFLIILLTLKNIQNKDANILYNDIKNVINEKNETLETFNDNFYSEVLDVFNSISENRSNN